MKKLILLLIVTCLSAFAQEAQFITESRQLTFVGPRSGEGYFSADGKKMIFQSERNEKNPFYQMFVLDLESGKTTRLSPGFGQTTCGWIHPKNTKAIWSSTHLDPKWKVSENKEIEERKSPVKKRYSWAYDPAYEIFESDLNGKAVKQLTKAQGYDAESSYSPNGEYIAFASNRTGYELNLSEEEKKLFEKDASSQMEIYIMKANGTNVKRLTRSLGYDGGPFFSADGSKITWRRFSADGSTAEIWTMNVDGSEQRQITRLGKLSWAPFFHPSGDYIIFASNIEGHSNFELYIVDSNGLKDPVRVTYADGFDGLATFTPDGTELSWTKRGVKGDSQIYRAQWNDFSARKALGLDPKSNHQTLSLQPSIGQKDLKALVEYLSSEDMKGRKTGSSEEKVYTAQIAKLFQSWGLKPAPGAIDYFHEFEFISGIRFGQNNSLSVEGLPIKQKQIAQLNQTFEPLSMSKNGLVPLSEVVFAGYGLRAPASEKGPAYDSYENLDVKDKWVLIFHDVPQDVSVEQRLHFQQYGRTEFKATVAKSEGARGLIVFPGPRTLLTETWGQPKLEGSPLDSGLSVIKISRDFAKILFQKAGQNPETIQKKLDEGLKSEGFLIQDLKIQAQVDLILNRGVGRNVVAVLPADLKKPSVSSLIIGAHGDHLGLGDQGSSLAGLQEKNQIHFGADDNASGVSAVLEMAHHFAKAPVLKKAKRKQDLYFAIWSGEEMGLLGSKAWIRDWKKKNGDLNKSFQAQLNLDMVGRLKDKLIIQGVGSSTLWPPMIEELAIKSGVPVSSQDDPYLPTDSMAFYIERIPTLNFFTGAHSEYHTPRDQSGLINYAGLEKVTRLGQMLIEDLAWTTQKISYVEIPQSRRNSQSASRSFRIFLGTIPDYSQDGVKGVRVSGVSKDSPAEKSGLKNQDIIVELGNQKIENLYDYTYVLQSLKPGNEIPLKIMRSGRLEELKIIPALKE